MCTLDASAGEICRFAGTTDYAGHVAITTDVTATDDVTRVDVVATFEATTMLWAHIRYLVEEVSTWRAGELESVAVNSRYLIGDHIVRQQWDDFQRGADGLQARRVQAKSLADFRLRHPGFVQHWDPTTFGQPWLDNYQSASPERRADLDLKGSPLPPGLRSPLAMAFYWVRWLPRGGQNVPVFLPGFKGERLVDLPIVSLLVVRRNAVASTLALLRAEREAGFDCHGLDVYRWPPAAARIRVTRGAWIGKRADQSGGL